jgi:hypothetical protein
MSASPNLMTQLTARTPYGPRYRANAGIGVAFIAEAAMSGISRCSCSCVLVASVSALRPVGSDRERGVTARKKSVAHGSRWFAQITLRSATPVRAPGGLRRALLAALAGLLLMSGWPAPAIAQSCRTPQVEARIKELGQRIERYRNRIPRLKQELSQLQAQAPMAERSLLSERTRDWLTELSNKISQTKQSIEFHEATLKRLVEERSKLESLPACPRPGPSVSAAPRSSREAAALAKALPGGRCHGAVAGGDLRQRDPDPGVMLSLIMGCQWLRGGNPH